MRQRFKARELWLFTPFLLVGVAALLYWRWEQVTPANERGAHVSSFQVKTAPGYWQEQGYSHQVKVVVSHPWPRPKWWGQMTPLNMGLDPLRPVPTLKPIRGYSEKDYLRSGGTLTIERQGKNASWPSKKPNHPYKAGFEDGNYVFVHFVNAFDEAKQQGAIRFRGLYKIGEQPALAVDRVFRKQGENLSVELDKNPAATLVLVDAMRFTAMKFAPPPPPKGKAKGRATTEIRSVIMLVVRPTEPAVRPDGQHTMSVYDLQVRDEAGKIYLDQKPRGFSFGVGGMLDRDEKQLKPGEILRPTVISIDAAIATSGRLTLNGKIAVDEHWPIPFQVALPPRESAIPPNVEWPQWTRPTPAATPPGK